MKRAISILLAGGILLLSGLFMPVSSKKGGTPTDDITGKGYSGGKFENGRTCATSQCHTGFASYRNNLISTNVPAEGYRLGQSYQVTVTVAEPGKVRFGFQATPQDSLGGFMGTMVSNSQVQLNLNPGYITHRQSSNSGSGSRSWSFTWNPPSQVGKGRVFFYTAVNAANDNDSVTGDLIYYDTIIIPEAINNFAGTFNHPGLKVNVFPVPVKETADILIEIDRHENVTGEIYDLAGRKILGIEKEMNAGQHKFSVDCFGWAPGYYLIRVKAGKSEQALRFLIQK